MNGHGETRLLQDDQNFGQVEEDDQSFTDNSYRLLTLSAVGEISSQILNGCQSFRGAGQAEGVQLLVEQSRQ